MRLFKFIYLMIALLLVPMSGFATVALQQSNGEQVQLNKSLKREFAQEKRMAQLEQKMEKWTKKLGKNKKVDLSDPVNKWAWLALGFAIIGLILSVTSLTSVLAEIAWGAAAVCLVIWFLKYFGVF